MQWLAANWRYLLGVALGLVSAIASAFVKKLDPDKHPAWMIWVIDWAAALPRTGMVGLWGLPISLPYVTMSLNREAHAPEVHVESADQPRGKGRVDGELLILLAIGTLACTLLLMSGCACWTAQHAADPACEAARVVVDCTERSAMDAVPNALPLVMEIISSGTTDWAAITARLEAAGFADGSCILAGLEHLFVGGAKVSIAGYPTPLGAVHDVFQRHRRAAPRISYRLREPNGRLVLE